MATEIEARLKITAQERTAKAFAAVEARLKKAERIADRVNRQQRQVALYEKTAGRVDRALLMGGTAVLGGLAAAGGVRRGLDTLTSYEDALIEIRKKGGLTADQMKQVGAEAKALATSGDLAVPLDEILASYERAAAAGLPMDDWREFAALSAKAADAFGMSAEDVGNAAAGFKVGLGIPISEMERYFDLINSLADSGISDESDIIKFLDNAGAGLKNFGLNAKEAAAYGATLLNLKLGPETGARMMNALTSKLIAPENLGKKGYSALKEVVGDVKAFKKELARDPQGAMRKFLGDLSKMDKFKRARLTGAIFGMEWSDEIMRLVDGLKELDRNIELARGKDWFGSLDKSYQMKLDALSSRWQLFKNQIGELTIDLGEMSMPALEAGLERARETVKQIVAEMDSFDEKLDAKEIDEAGEALAEMASGLRDLLGLDPAQSQIAVFFRDMATMVNEIATGIKAIRDFGDWLANPGDRVQQIGSDELAKLKADHDAQVQQNGPSWYQRLREWTGADWLGGQDWWTQPAPDAPVPSLPTTSLPQQFWDGLTGVHDWMNAQHGKVPDINPLIPPVVGSPFGGMPGSPPSDNWLPAPPVPPSPSDLPPLTLQIDGVDDTADALRQAMQTGGGEITRAGGDVAAAINGAAGNLREAGLAAAAAISGARIQVPNVPAAPRSIPGPNANLGQSMPTAGTPGGG